MLLIASPMRSYLSFFKISSINKHTSMNTCFENIPVRSTLCCRVPKRGICFMILIQRLSGHLPVKVVTNVNVQSNYKIVLRSLVGDSGDLDLVLKKLTPHDVI